MILAGLFLFLVTSFLKTLALKKPESRKLDPTFTKMIGKLKSLITLLDRRFCMSSNDA